MARGTRSSGTASPDAGNQGSSVGSDAGLIIADDVASSVNDAGLIIVDPSDFGNIAGNSSIGDDGNSTGEPRKRRGRKPNSTSSRASKTQALDLNGVEAILFSAHALLAGIAKTPEFALDKTEANELAKAIGNVSRHYDVAASAKTVDMANLVMVCGMVYGSRILAIRARKSTEKKAKQSPDATNHDGVVSFPFNSLNQ